MFVCVWSGKLFFFGVEMGFGIAPSRVIKPWENFVVFVFVFVWLFFLGGGSFFGGIRSRDGRERGERKKT